MLDFIASNRGEFKIRELSPDNLLEEFGPGSAVCKKAISALWACFANIFDLPKVNTCYEQWQLFFSLSTQRLISGRELAKSVKNYGLDPFQIEDEEDVLKFLFIIHTFYSLLLKLLACAIADQSALSSVSLLRKIEKNPANGLNVTENTFPRIITNVIERDIFSWFQEAWNKHTSGIIREIAWRLGNYTVRGVRRDVLKRVYQYLIPSKLRKALGEFYTKDWTAEDALDAIGFDGSEGRLLDPACGSGTFLVLAINRIKSKVSNRSKTELLNEILERIIGFDVNPLAVMTARINYLLAIEDLIEGEVDGIRLPVYLCDSIVISKDNCDIQTEKFDYVVGNPPWIAPERVEKSYRDMVFELMKKSGFLKPYEPEFQKTKAKFPSAGAQFVACLSFVERALKHYLKPNGKLGFLLTSSMMKSLNAGGFRKKMQSYGLKKLIDYTLDTKIHEGASCWAFIPVIENTEEVEQAEEINYEYYIPLKRGSHPEERPYFEIFHWKIKKNNLTLSSDPLSPWFTAPTESVKIFRKMQNHPRIGDIYELNRGILTSANKIYFLKNIEKAEGNLYIVETEGNERINAEGQLLYPLVRGVHLNAWNFNYEYVLVPHDSKNLKPISEAVMQRKYPEAYRHFINNKKRLTRRQDYSKDKGPFYMIFRISPRKIKDWKTAYCLIAPKLQVSVIPSIINDTLLNKRAIIIDHSVYFINTDTENEAYYLCAMLNSIPLRSFCLSIASPKSGFPGVTKQFFMWTVGVLPIPRYDMDSDLCKEIIRLSKEATNLYNQEKLNLVQEIENKINELSAKMYDINENELMELKQHLEILSGEALTNQA